MRIDSASRIPETPSVPQFSIEWSHMEKYLEDRKNAHLKKRLDASIRAKMLPISSSFVSSTDIQVFVLPFQGQVIRTLVANMDFEDDLKFNDCLKEMIAKHSRHKKVSHFTSSKPIECGSFYIFWYIFSFLSLSSELKVTRWKNGFIKKLHYTANLNFLSLSLFVY
jgi:hypothetical protein